MEKKCRVILLESPKTNKKGDICKFGYGLNIASVDDIGYPVYHLYVLSEDGEIKVGEYIECAGKIGKVIKILETDKFPYLVEDGFRLSRSESKKVIASTDETLAITEIPNPYGREEFMPQIRESVVKAFIEDYNKGNVWKYVNVEYEYYLNSATDKNDLTFIRVSLDKEILDFYGDRVVSQLKLSSDNTIIIHLMQETFTREEVEDILQERHKYYNNSELNGMYLPIVEWFNTNY